MQVEEYDDWRDLFDRLRTYASSKVSVNIYNKPVQSLLISTQLTNPNTFPRFPTNLYLDQVKHSKPQSEAHPETASDTALVPTSAPPRAIREGLQAPCRP